MRGRVIPYILDDGRVIEVVVEANPVHSDEEKFLKLIKAKGSLLGVDIIQAGDAENKRAVGFGLRFAIDYNRNDAGKHRVGTKIYTPEEAVDFPL